MCGDSPAFMHIHVCIYIEYTCLCTCVSLCGCIVYYSMCVHTLTYTIPTPMFYGVMKDDCVLSTIPYSTFLHLQVLVQHHLYCILLFLYNIKFSVCSIFLHFPQEGTCCCGPWWRVKCMYDIHTCCYQEQVEPTQSKQNVRLVHNM